MVKLSGCDCVKLEVAAAHTTLVRALADTGVAVIAHLGLRPQSVGLVGGYRFQGRTADEAAEIVELAQSFERAGAAALLLEAVVPEVSAAVVAATDIPVIGCGAGPAFHSSVVVTHDIVGLTSSPPRFAPAVADLASPAVNAYARYAQQVASGEYPGPDHQYSMDPDERTRFLARARTTPRPGIRSGSESTRQP